MKCPFCDSVHVLKDGYDEQSMDIWRCMACGETITQADLDEKNLDEEGNEIWDSRNDSLLRWTDPG